MTKPINYSLFLISFSIVLVALGIFIFDLLTKNMYSFFGLKAVILLIISSIIGSIISIIAATTIPYFKEFLLSFRSLLRFESLSHPLLIKLSLEAPGTYHHSLMVANLAYQAAKAINADAILTRVGSYYHDIGKLSDPRAFIENQKSNLDLVNFNNYSKNDLHESSKTIINHVTFGLKLAQKYSLPKEIAAFIPEHHGTTHTRYFYREAQKRKFQVKKNDFRYPGPKPLSREIAIVMLADAIEARIRLIDKLDKEKILEIVDQVIFDRLREKQLNLCGLNDMELKKIRNSFISTLSTIHHQRIDYPD